MHGRQLVTRLGMAASPGSRGPATAARAAAGTTPTGSPATRCSHMSAHSELGRSVAAIGFGLGMVMVPPVWPGLAAEFHVSHLLTRRLKRP